MLLAPVVWVLAAVICYIFIQKIWWFPVAINAHAAAFDVQFMRTLVVVGVIFFLAQFALGYVIVRYRDTPRRGVVYSHGNNRLETIWTTATAVLFLGLVVMGTKIWAGVQFDPAPPDAMVVQVMAKQFAWNFRYPGPDGKFGRTDLKLVNDASGNPFGIDDRDPAGRDDITSASLKIPVGKPVKLMLESRDVIHNFFVRELRVKQDVVPGMEIPLHFQADRAGVYEVPCSELCGLGHFQMRTTVQVLTQEAFDEWTRQQAAQQ